MPEGRLFIITAPSGAGKTSLVREMLRRNAQLAVSVSHTTRTKRPGDEEGVDYYFVSREEFADLIARDAFWEHAEVFGYHYGTSRTEVARHTEAGRSVILEIDWQGAQLVRAQMPEAISIFILPPSIDTLEQRLRGRGTDSSEVIQRRLGEARDEIRHCGDFEHCVMNDDFEAAAAQLQRILENPEQVEPYTEARPCHAQVHGM